MILENVTMPNLESIFVTCQKQGHGFGGYNKVKYRFCALETRAGFEGRDEAKILIMFQ